MNHIFSFNPGLARKLSLLLVGLSFLAMLAGSVSLAVVQFGLDWRSQLVGRYVVVIDSEGKSDAAMQSLRQELTARLAAEPRIATSHVYSESELRELLVPWLGQLEDNVIPMPIVADIMPKRGKVQTPPMPAQDAPANTNTNPPPAPNERNDNNNDVTISASDLQIAMRDLDPQIKIDDLGGLRRQFSRFAEAVTLAGGFAFLLLLLVMLGIILILTNALFEIHRHDLHTLHLLGASDATIAGYFRQFIWHLSLRAQARALLLYFFAFALYLFASKNIGSLQIFWLWLVIVPIFSFLILPLVFAITAFFSARWAVRGWP